MTAIVEVENLTKRFGSVTAVDDASFAVQENSICGLLGRNGAGKTTLMQLITGQEFASSGTMRVFGESPVENAAVLSRTCFVIAWVWATTAAASWGAVGDFLTENSVLTIVLWTVPVTLVTGVAGYLFLRRATPK